MKSYAHTKSWSRRGFCRWCLPADDNNFSSFTHNYCLSNMMCTPVIWLLLFLRISRRPTVGVSIVSGEFVFYFSIYTPENGDVYEDYLYFISKSRPPARSSTHHCPSSPPRVVTAQNWLLYTHTCV